MSVLRSDATPEERRRAAYLETDRRLRAQSWDAPPPEPSEARAAEAAALIRDLKDGLYVGRPIQQRRALARLEELMPGLRL